MSRPALEVADVFRRHARTYREAHADSLSRGQRRVMSAIECCRTSALGGHLEQCDACGYQRNAFNSCRNRHCPKCQSLARAQWLEEREAELLDCEYFHVVFTIPQQLAVIAFQNKPIVYDILFHATAETLTTIAADPQHLGARIGFMALLHTWGQTLMHHPHLHCVVPGGGLSPDGSRWIACPKGFFLPVKVSRVCSAGCSSNNCKGPSTPANSSSSARSSASPIRSPSAATSRRSSPPNGLSTLSAPSPVPSRFCATWGATPIVWPSPNNRLLGDADGKISFDWKDYKNGSAHKIMTLTADEFIRRFLLHVLPKGLQRIRHFGFLGNRYREQNVAKVRELLGQELAPGNQPDKDIDYRDRYEQLTGESLVHCPVCRRGQMLLTRKLPAPSPHRALDSS